MSGMDPRSLLESVRTLQAQLMTVLAWVERAETQGADLSSLLSVASSFYETQARFIRDVDTFLESHDSGDRAHTAAVRDLSAQAAAVIQGLDKVLGVLGPTGEMKGLTLRLSCALHNWHTLAEDLHVLLSDPGAQKIETILLNLPVSPHTEDEPAESVSHGMVQ